MILIKNKPHVLHLRKYGKSFSEKNIFLGDWKQSQ